ncbi:MAG: hypothetical protein J6B07_03820 [Opitutales bacterium]|nr:hypothetical protein [Opitutales bacterium]
MNTKKIKTNVGTLEKKILLGTIIRSYDDTSDAWILKFNFFRIFLLLSILIFCGWIIVVTAIFTYFKHVKNFQEITLIDAISAPINISGFREKMGEYNIKEANKLFKQKEFNQAFLMLTSGVSRSPNNLDARMQLAIIHATLNKREYAARILEHKLPLAFDKNKKEYIQTACILFATIEEFEYKSIALLKKATIENYINEKEAIETLTKIFAVKNNNLEASKRFFLHALNVITTPKRVSEFIAKSVALIMIRDDNVKSAKKILSDNNITSGEVFAQIKLIDLIEAGNEIEALKYSKILLNKTANPSQIYRFTKKIHNDFGNLNEVKNCENMANLTSTSSIASDIYIAIKNKNIQFIKNALENKIEQVIIHTIRNATILKDKDVLQLCLNAIQDINKNRKIEIQIILCESFLKLNDVALAEKLLHEIKSLNKNSSKESTIEKLQMAIALKAKNATYKQIKEFRNKLQDNEMFKFAQLLKDNGYYAEAISILDQAKTQNKNQRKIDKLIFEIYAEQKNCTNIARYLSKARNVCPVKILVSDMFDNPSSDKFVMLSDSEINVLKNEIDKAKLKLQQYKKLFSF